MPEDTGGDRHIPATPRKRERMREEGNVARSQDLSSAWALLVALIALLILGDDIWDDMLGAGRFYLSHFDEMVRNAPEPRAFAWRALAFTFNGTGWFLAVMLVTGVAINLLQVGFILTGKPVVPKLERLNPISGMQKFFSTRSLMELVKSLAKLTLVSAIAWFTLSAHAREVLLFALLSPESLVSAVGGIIVAVWWRIVAAMIAIGLLDYAFQRWRYEQDMRMTDQEFRQEVKEMEGDPHIKRRVRQLQRQMAMQRMMAEVPKADVVITNPTHYAVALRYDVDEMQAPRVLAKGERLMAGRIRDLAVENDVPIVERPELARTLFRTVEVGQTIPEGLFRAVAEVLSFVYRIDRRADRVRERDRAWKKTRAAV